MTLPSRLAGAPSQNLRFPSVPDAWNWLSFLQFHPAVERIPVAPTSLLQDPASRWLDEREHALITEIDGEQMNPETLALAAARLRNMVSGQRERERRARLRRGGETDEDVLREGARMDLFQRALRICQQRLDSEPSE